MKNFTLINGIVCDPSSEFHSQVVSIVIKNNKIETIGANLKPVGEVIDVNKAFVFPGWIDTLSVCGAPGAEQDEDFETLANTAVAGGYTKIASLFGNGHTIYTAAAVKAIINQTEKLPLPMLVIANITNKGAGEELAEMYDMEQNGAAAFFDGTYTEHKSSLQVILNSYAHLLQKTIYHWPWSFKKYPGAVVNQSLVGTSLGLKGFPEQMEESLLNQYLQEFDFTEGKHHFPYITTENAAKIISKNTSKNLSFAVPIYNLVYTDEHLEEFDENFKIMPPLRSKKQRDFLIKLIGKETAMHICSNHTPVDIEDKQREFIYSKFGAASLQVIGSHLLTLLGPQLFMQYGAQLLSHGAAKVLGIQPHSIIPGAVANITVFDPQQNWILNASTNKSASQNYPSWNQQHHGKPSFSVINGTLFKL